MESGATPGGYSRAPVLVGTAIAVLIALVAAVDFRGVIDDIPPVPPTCVPPTDEACNLTRVEGLDARADRAGELEDDFDARAWIYGFGALAAVLVGGLVAFARTDGALRREVFTDLGVIAVLWLLAGLVLTSTASGELVDVPAGAIFYPGLALLAVAAAGTLFTWGAYHGESEPRPEKPAGTAVRVIGFGATAIAVVLSLIVFGDRGDPCLDPVSDTIDTLVPIAMGAAGVAVLAGFASLIQRRWLGALVMLAAGPFCALFAALTTVCWN